jgi:uncharacterized protein YoaH (UPF0181 family)
MRDSGQRRVDGRWPYGEHPSHEHDSEREAVARIRKMHADGMSSYAIAKQLNSEGVRTRPSKSKGGNVAVGRQFKVQTVQNILERSECAAI